MKELKFRNHHELYLFLEDLGFDDCYYDSNYDWCVSIKNEKNQEVIVTSAGSVIINNKYFDQIDCLTLEEFDKLIE